LIRGWGLEDYYALRDQLGSVSERPVARAQDLELLNDPAVLGSSWRTLPDGRCQVRMSVRGLHCAACAWLIERAPRLVDGWQDARVQMTDATLDIVFDPARTKLSRIGEILSQFGYRIGPWRASAIEQLRREEQRRELIRLAVAGFCMANAMWIAVALYAGEFTGMAHDIRRALEIAGSALGAIAVAIPGSVFFRSAWAALRTRSPHVDLPLALGLGVGAVWGCCNAIRGRGDVYFDSLAALVFLLLLGRWLQGRQQRAAADSVRLLLQITPAVAQRYRTDGQGTERVPADQLSVDDVVLVAAGELLPADGVVVKGSSTIDQSLLTGESVPTAIEPGDVVAAGTLNSSSALDVRVTAIGPESRLGRLMRLIEQAATRQAPVVLLADRIAGRFVIAVLLLALVTGLVWAWRDPAIAIDRVVALLIVSCPCALALATPLAVSIAVGQLARRRILVKGGETLERLSRPGRLWLDKTGTLTEGRWQVVAHSLDEFDLAALASIESQSAHPVARAIVRLAHERGLAPLPVHDVAQSADGGIQGVHAGHVWSAGSARYFALRSTEIPGPLLDQGIEQGSLGRSIVYVQRDGAFVGWLSLADQLRSDARTSLDKLRDQGWEPGILSGDHPRIVERIADALAIPSARALGGLTPEEKVSLVAQPATEGSVVMVGDGINDAAALARADVGVAVHGGAELSMQVAPVYLARPGLEPLLELTDTAARTIRVIRRNFTAALAYNSVAIALAVTGYINPLIAALLMPASSLTVVAITMLGSRARAQVSP
jgi:Cu2+-exporting ATPase